MSISPSDVAGPQQPAVPRGLRPAGDVMRGLGAGAAAHGAVAVRAPHAATAGRALRAAQRLLGAQ